tara:strand:- start:290 stop:508 length:219 start_codon:yes stop_codon:yes gene_type:complete
MIITRTSPLTKIENSIEIEVTSEQIARWQDGENIQNVMPTLTHEEREFIMTGFTFEDWRTLFSETLEESEDE